MTESRVFSTISNVMILYWTDSKEYYEELHRQLEPLARELERENNKLRAAIKQTLDENGHLADGDNCTLILLKQAIAHKKKSNEEFCEEWFQKNRDNITRRAISELWNAAIESKLNLGNSFFK